MLPRIIRLILCSWFPPSRVKVTSLYTRAISVYKGYQCGGPKVRHDNLDNRHNCNRRRIENSENLRFPARPFFFCHQTLFLVSGCLPLSVPRQIPTTWLCNSSQLTNFNGCRGSDCRPRLFAVS